MEIVSLEVGLSQVFWNVWKVCFKEFFQMWVITQKFFVQIVADNVVVKLRLEFIKIPDIIDAISVSTSLNLIEIVRIVLEFLAISWLM